MVRSDLDNLTHGLLGLALGALVPERTGPDKTARGPSPTRKAALLAGFLAAELPDLDTLWPAADPVLHALRAHRGISHSLVFAPVIILAATAIARGVFRQARTGPAALAATLSVLFAHLLADLWTGWGTRLLLPFSDERLTLDWAMVVDPLITLPLLVAFVFALRHPGRWRRAAAVGLLLAGSYLGARIVLRAVSSAEVRAKYPTATRIEVFPAWFSLRTWRYVAVLPGTYAAGEVTAFAGLEEQHRAAVQGPEVLAPQVRAVPTVEEAVAWARLPQVEQTRTPQGTTVRVSDLRYHLRGQPTLSFVIQLDERGQVLEAALERGGSAKALFERWRKDDGAASGG